MSFWQWFGLVCFVVSVWLQVNWYRKQPRRGWKAFLGWKE